MVFFFCSMFDCNVSHMEIPPQKYSPSHLHLRNGSQLTSQNAKFSSSLNFRLIKILFPFRNPWKIVFFYSFIIKCKQNPKTKIFIIPFAPCLRSGFTIKIAKLFSLFVLRKTNFLKTFFLKLYFFNFSMFEFNILNTKVPEENILNFEMIHN